MENEMPRRSALKTIAKGAAVAATASASHKTMAAHHESAETLKGNIRHSVCKWCYKDYTLDELCAAAARIGMESVELVNIDEAPTLRKHGLTSALIWGVPGGIKSGLNRLENHDAIVEYFEHTTPRVAEAGYPNIICFSGNREGMSDEEGLENCAIGLKRIAPIAEKHGVTVVMELLNSRHNHPDYMCDHTEWGVELCQQVGSERFKLLYDIYHMQIMEGDVIHRIREFQDYIGHYHTGGVPGRHEIDETQELYYPAIMQAILDTGYKGFVGQEFVPAGPDPIASLEQGVRICDV